jgi:outer membrane immunogenic protein
MLRGVILAGASLIALTAAANAADLNRVPVIESYKDVPSYGVNWSGMYVGVNGGYGWDESNISGKLPPDFRIKPEGGFGGGQIGVNWQQGNIVFGLEADLQAASITDTKSIAIGQYTLGTKSTLDWFGTLRGRLGYAAGPALVYATGGLAYGRITDEKLCSSSGPCDCAPNTAWKNSTDASGYVAGAGAEYKLNPNWSVKAEYQYINLGQESAWAKDAKEDYEVSTVRAGLNYHLGGGYGPLK